MTFATSASQEDTHLPTPASLRRIALGMRGLHTALAALARDATLSPSPVKQARSTEWALDARVAYWDVEQGLHVLRPPTGYFTSKFNEYDLQDLALEYFFEKNDWHLSYHVRLPEFGSAPKRFDPAYHHRYFGSFTGWSYSELGFVSVALRRIGGVLDSIARETNGLIDPRCCYAASLSCEDNSTDPRWVAQLLAFGGGPRGCGFYTHELIDKEKAKLGPERLATLEEAESTIHKLLAAGHFSVVQEDRETGYRVLAPNGLLRVLALERDDLSRLPPLELDSDRYMLIEDLARLGDATGKTILEFLDEDQTKSKTDQLEENGESPILDSAGNTQLGKIYGQQIDSTTGENGNQTVAQRLMRFLCENGEDALCMSQRALAESLGCSASAIAKTEVWKRLRVSQLHAKERRRQE